MNSDYDRMYAKETIAELEEELNNLNSPVLKSEWQEQQSRMAELEVEVDRLREERGAAYLEGHADADTIWKKWCKALDAELEKHRKALAEVAKLEQEYTCYCPSCAVKLQVTPTKIAREVDDE